MPNRLRKAARPITVLAAALLIVNCDWGSFLDPVPPSGAATAVEIRIDGFTDILAEEDTVLLRAVFLDRDGAGVNGLAATWSSSDPAVASVESVSPDQALFIAHQPGSATIRATSETLSASTSVEVHPRPVDLVYVSGSGQTGDAGSLLRDSLVVRAIDRRGDPVSGVRIDFQALQGGGPIAPASALTDAQGRTRAAWTLGHERDQSARAHASADQPRIKHMKDSVVVFTARAILPVSAVTVFPEVATLEEGDTLRLRATATAADGGVVSDVVVEWASTDTTVATISTTGLLRARRSGAAAAVARIATTTGTLADTAHVHVTMVAPTLVGIEVRPAEATVDTSATRAFDALGRWNDGSETAVPVTWSATGGRIDAQGLFTAGARPGIFQVIALHAGGHADTAVVTIVAPAPSVARVVVSPAADTIDALGHAAQLSARAEDGGGADLSGVEFVWTSLDPTVATVDAGGTVTARSVGSVLVVAAAAGCADTALVVVRQVPAAVAVDPAEVSLVVGQAQQLEATVRDAGGSPIPEAAVTWGSSRPSIASASQEGIVQALEVGTAVITAASAGTTGEARVDVQAATSPTDTFPVDQRPYTADSPWNTPIPGNAALDPESDALIATIRASSNGTLRSDPSQYTYPVHFVDSSTPRTTLVCIGVASINYLDGTRKSTPDGRLTDVPIPAGALPSEGSDGQLILVDVETGDEYDIWRFVPPNGCTNATRYVGGVYRSGVERSYASRGAGVPYLAGLIRPWEIDQGRIEHALAFAYTLSRAVRCVWPASKTDGDDDRADAIPEGARLRLDPTLDVATIEGLDETGRIIARALQEYGMILIDNSGANKIYAEDNLTAAWGTRLVATTVSAIPVDRLQVLRLPDAYWAEEYVPNHGRCVR